MFHDITLTQAERVLNSCKSRSLAAGELLCEEGSSPLEMYILLIGELSVMKNNVEIATIKPVTTVGEMGVVTGETRTASLAAKVPSRLLVIRKIELDSIMRRDIDLGLTIFKNFATTLSKRLAETNTQLDRLRKENEQLKRQIAESEQGAQEKLPGGR